MHPIIRSDQCFAFILRLSGMVCMRLLIDILPILPSSMDSRMSGTFMDVKIVKAKKWLLSYGKVSVFAHNPGAEIVC